MRRNPNQRKYFQHNKKKNFLNQEEMCIKNIEHQRDGPDKRDPEAHNNQKTKSSKQEKY